MATKKKVTKICTKKCKCLNEEYCKIMCGTVNPGYNPKKFNGLKERYAN